MQRLRLHVKTMEAVKTMEYEDTTVINQIITVEKYTVHNTTGIGAEAVMVESTVILHITVGHTECVPIWVNTAGPQNMATKRTHYGVTIFCAVR